MQFPDTHLGRQSSRPAERTAADTKKHGRRLSSAVLDRISALVDRGYDVAQVQEVLEREWWDQAPDIRTTRRHVRRLQQQFRAGRWRRGANVPWEPVPPAESAEPVPASRLGELLPVLAAALAAGHPWPTTDVVCWWDWVRAMAPDLRPADVPDLAALWRARRAQDQPTRDLVLFLAYRPWQGAAAFGVYLAVLFATGEPLYPFWHDFPAVAGAWLVETADVVMMMLTTAWETVDRLGGPGAAQAAAGGGWETFAQGIVSSFLQVLPQVRALVEVVLARTLAPGPHPDESSAWTGRFVLDAPTEDAAFWRARVRRLRQYTAAFVTVLCAFQDWLARGLPPARRLSETRGAAPPTAPRPHDFYSLDRLADADWERFAAFMDALVALQPVPIDAPAPQVDGRRDGMPGSERTGREVASAHPPEVSIDASDQ